MVAEWDTNTSRDNDQWIWYHANQEINQGNELPPNPLANWGKSIPQPIEYGENKVDIAKAVSSLGPLAFLKAANDGDVAEVMARLKAGVDVDYLNSRGYSAAMLAARHNKPEVLKVLVHAGTNINNQQVNGGHTPLHLAAVMGHIDAVKVLLQAGTDRTLRNQFNQTAEEGARSSGHNDLAELIKNYNGQSGTTKEQAGTSLGQQPKASVYKSKESLIVARKLNFTRAGYYFGIAEQKFNFVGVFCFLLSFMLAENWILYVNGVPPSHRGIIGIIVLGLSDGLSMIVACYLTQRLCFNKSNRAKFFYFEVFLLIFIIISKMLYLCIVLDFSRIFILRKWFPILGSLSEYFNFFVGASLLFLILARVANPFFALLLGSIAFIGSYNALFALGGYDVDIGHAIVFVLSFSIILFFLMKTFANDNLNAIRRLGVPPEGD
jgi:hypothetical protein